ncbi:MAG: ATP-binding protein [Solirubrobacterales bacterium]|nr:ATP-binding protein [Solirubrobacterales bacterium]
MPDRTQTTNPFRYGDLALDDAFTDRVQELQELKADMRNGQNVVVFAPRRYGKSSLIWRAAHELIAARQVLVAQVDLMKTPTKERFAEKLAASIYEDVTSSLFKVKDRAIAAFRGLRVAPMITVNEDGSLAFSFQAGYAPSDLDATIEHLLELPAKLGAERRKRVALVFDEFQEIVNIDRRLLPLMRSVFQEQPEVAHVYLGSKRHMMEQIFSDVNEPFWRSARQMELGVLPSAVFADFLRTRFERTSRSIDDTVVDLVLRTTHSHPYGTQELAYALWEVTPRGRAATRARYNEALTRVLRSENGHFSRIWERAPRAQRVALEALAKDPGEPPLGNAYRRRHNLPGPSTVQRALEALDDDELIERTGGGYRIAEPFLAEWILRNDV